MHLNEKAGLSEGRLVLVIGLLTVAALVGLMAVGSTRSLKSGGGDASSLRSEIERLSREIEFARQEAEDKQVSVDQLREKLLVAAEGVDRSSVEEQAELEAEVAGLRTRVADLTSELAVLSLSAGGDGELPPARERPDLAAKVLQNVRVVDVNPDILFAVIDVGDEHGIVPGMEFRVVRDGEMIALVSAEDVREVLTGVTVKETEGGLFPQPGDRAILVMN